MKVFVASAAELLTDAEGHGEGLIAWSLLAGLAARGHELVVCAREARIVEEPPFEVVELGRASSFESVEPLAYARRASRELARRGPESFDVVHWLYPPLEPGGMLPRTFGRPLVVGPVAARWPRRFARRRTRPGDLLQTLLEPFAGAVRKRRLEHAAVVLLQTPDVPAPRGPRPVLFPPGVTLPAPAPLPDLPRIAFVGGLDPRKGIRELLVAFAAVRRELPGAELVLAGDGPERAAAESAPGVTVLGAVPHERVQDILAGAALFCLPSWFEAYSLATAEAMAAGRAVVGTDVPGLRFLVDPRGGRLVPPADADALAAALLELLRDRDALERLGAFNRARVESELTIERALDRLEAIYVEVAA